MSSLVNIHRTFDSCINRAYAHIRMANKNLSTSSTKSWHTEYLYDIYEVEFLKVFTSWETFLESSFIGYMTGRKTRKYKPGLYLKKINEKHALDILRGTREYPDWTNINNVCKFAELYFIKGEPFLLPLRGIETYFNQMKMVRNAITHGSSHSKSVLKRLVADELSVYSTDIAPGEFLASSIGGNNNKTFFEYYTQFLQIAASKIIHI